MTAHTKTRSENPAMPDLAALDPMDQLAILCMRGLGRREADLSDRLAAHFGPDLSQAIVARCDDLLQFLAQNARRPLERRDPDAEGIGADEAAFAHLCRLAASGERDAILMHAILICRTDMAPCLVPLAESFVLTLRRGLASITREAGGCPVHHSTQSTQRIS